MTTTIYKYPLDLVDRQVRSMPIGAEVLTAQVQRNEICLWAIVPPGQPNEERIFEIIGTGNPVVVDIGVERRYIATVQQGEFVWHVFERL